MVGGQPLPIINKGRLGVWACDQLGHTTTERCRKAGTEQRETDENKIKRKRNQGGVLLQPRPPPLLAKIQELRPSPVSWG